MRVVVADDGVGFDPGILDEKIVRNEGFGLFNLRERLAYVRGSVEIESQRGKGTKVALVAPLQPARRIKTRRRQ